MTESAAWPAPWWLVVFPIMAGAACAPSAPEPAPTGTGASAGQGVLVVVVDGLRADRVSAFGYGRETTPRCDALAAEGAAFLRTISPAPQLVPAHAALVSGSDPNLARRDVPTWMATTDPVWFLPPEAPRLAVELGVAGFRSAAFSSHPFFAPVYGFGVGFHEFFPRWPETPDEPLTRPGETFEDVRRWLATLRRGESWFAYVQLAGLEDCFNRPDPRWSQFFEPDRTKSWVPPRGTNDPCLFAVPPSRAADGNLTMGEYEVRYDGALREIDHELGRFLDGLEQLGRLDGTTVCVVGSCGMQFGEAGLLLDHGRLSVADLHVPWILRPARDLPGPRGVRHDELTSTLDLAPTVLELHDIEPPEGMLGTSFAALVRGEQADLPPRRVVVASCAIQGGNAAFTRDLAVEWTLPGQVRERALVRGWYGDLEKHAGAVEERVYDWVDQPYPPLHQLASPWIPQPDERKVELRAATLQWMSRVETLRDELQRPFEETLLGGGT